MRSYQVFASMSPEQAVDLLRGLAEAAPGVAAQAVGAAAVAMKARPVYLQRQPVEKRAHSVRRALSRVACDPIAGEVLAVYFLECRKDLLTDWLDRLGLQHEDGILEEDQPKSPPDDRLRKEIEAFRRQDDSLDRELLLRTFSAQSAIDWPVLDALIEAGPD